MPRIHARRAFHIRPYTGQSVRPVASVQMDPTSVMPAARASTQPIGCVAKLSTIRPFDARAKAVVIPQEGHGNPKRVGHEQGGSPSARCVPKPSAAGGSSHAMTRSDPLAAATQAAAR